MRGFGDSDKPCGVCEYTIDKLVDDVHQLITELGLLFFYFQRLISLGCGDIRTEMMEYEIVLLHQP